MSAKHRISFDLSKPVKFMGLTKEELGLLLIAFFVFVLIGNKTLASLISGICILLFVFLRRLKKNIQGFNLQSFLWWHLGISKGKETLPPSHTRRIG